MFKRKKKKTGCETPEFISKVPMPPVRPARINPNFGWQPQYTSTQNPPPPFNPPTSGSNAVKPPERGMRIKCNPIDDVCDININNIIESFKSQQFVCSMCGKVISPEVKVNQDGSIEMTSETGEIRGGLGNKVIKNHICSQCMKNVSFIDKENAND